MVLGPYNWWVMSQKQESALQAQQPTQQVGPSSMVQSRDSMQDLVGNQAILEAMREEMSEADCQRYEMWVPEIQRCLATGAAPPSAMGNALIAIIGAKLLGWATGGYLGVTAATSMPQTILRGAAAQMGGALGSMMDHSGSHDASQSEQPSKAIEK